MTIERRRVLFSGHVQGVGFRMTTRRLALAWPVVGTVRNCDDGRVELVIEGEPDAVAGLLNAIDRSFGDSIDDREVSIESPNEPPISGFSIR